MAMLSPARLPTLANERQLRWPRPEESSYVLPQRHTRIASECQLACTAAATASLILSLRKVSRGSSRHGMALRRHRGSAQLPCSVSLHAAAVAEVATLGEPSRASELPKPRPLQIIKIDLETNQVLIGEEEIKLLEKELEQTGVEKVAIVSVMGAFRTGKSFLLDLMLRYLREKHPRVARKEADKDICEVPAWFVEKKVPDWAVKCGATMLEGREGIGREDLEGFTWRPGMEKCTEGIWVWSEAFVCKAGDEDVAVVLMDTQGAWDAKMSKEQSATVFGLTTLMSSRLVYNVSRQIQQDKIDNLLYFTDFAQAALRTQDRSANAAAGKMPFQQLDFLVRDWPHYEADFGMKESREMMQDHLDQYFSSERSEDTKSVESLKSLFQEIDIWCLPHPSLSIERDSWNGDLSVMEASFWIYVNGYLEKVFSPTELRAKTHLGNPVTVKTFGTVLREFIAAFGNAAPQAKSFSEAMAASSGLLAQEMALKKLRQTLAEKARKSDSALPEAEFDKIAAAATQIADDEFTSMAIFGTDEGIQRRKNTLLKEVRDEISRARDENEQKLEASLNPLTDLTIAALAGFAVDRVSDVTCDWWAPFCQELSYDLAVLDVGVAVWIGYSLFKISESQGQLTATTAALELAKSVTKKVKKFLPSGDSLDKEKDVDKTA